MTTYHELGQAIADALSADQISAIGRQIDAQEAAGRLTAAEGHALAHQAVARDEALERSTSWVQEMLAEARRKRSEELGR